MPTTDRPLRRIFTFVQATTPTGQVVGDTWWQPGVQRAWQWDGSLWQVFEFASDPVGYAGVAGYVPGGWNSGGNLSSVERLLFHNESMARLATTLVTASYGTAGVASSTSGYRLGGWASTYDAVIHRLRFDTEATSTLTTSLSAANYGAGSFESATRGYSAGGVITGGTIVSTITALQFSDEKVVAVAATLAALNAYPNTGFQSMLAGFIPGGGNGSPFLSGIDKLLFSTEYRSALVSTLSAARYQSQAFQSYLAGYVCNGYNGSNINGINRVLFSSEAVNTQASTLGTNTYAAAPTNSRIAGYSLGGYTTVATAGIQRLDFNSEVTSSLGSLLSAVSAWSCGFENLAR
jgi:hypothetical protein